MELHNHHDRRNAYMFRVQSEIDSMVGLVSDDLADTIDIGTDNHINVDSIVDASTPKLVLPGGYVPRIPNPLPTGPHPMMERAYAAHENRLSRYSGKYAGPVSPSVVEIPTPKLLENRIALRPFTIVMLEMVAMFVFFIGKTLVDILLFAPRTLMGSNPAPKTSHAPVSRPTRHVPQESVFSSIVNGVRLALTPFMISVWVFVTTVLTMLQGYGVVNF